MSATTSRLAARLLPALTMAAFLGCSDGRPKTYPVDGKLVYKDGAPVPGATVTFSIPLDGGKMVAARGRVKEDGTFKLTTFDDGDGAVAGEHHVAIVPLPRAEGDRTPNPVPRGYEDATQSGLKATVNPEPTTLVIQIDRPGKR